MSRWSGFMCRSRGASERLFDCDTKRSNCLKCGDVLHCLRDFPLQGWTVRGSNPGGVEIFHDVQTGPEAHPASCTMGTGSFPGAKRPECGANHTHPSSARLQMGWSYIGAFPICPTGMSWGDLCLRDYNITPPTEHSNRFHLFHDSGR
jgi:hypothetical protein